MILAKEEDVMVLRLADGTQPNLAQHTTAGPLPKGEAAIEAFLTGRGSPLALDKDNGEAIKKLGEKFRSAIADEYRGVYFVANGWYLFTGFVLSVIAVASLFLFGNLSDDEFERSILFCFLSIFSTGISFGLAHLVAKPFKSVVGEAFEDFVTLMSFSALTVGGLYLVNLLTALITDAGSQIPLLPLFVLVMVILLIVYTIYIDVPTTEGRSKMDEIEGLKLYLSVAEKERLNMSGVPEMTTGILKNCFPMPSPLALNSHGPRVFRRGYPALPGRKMTVIIVRPGTAAATSIPVISAPVSGQRQHRWPDRFNLHYPLRSLRVRDLRAVDHPVAAVAAVAAGAGNRCLLEATANLNR
ncbi:DUF2207 family protein [Roseibium algae]|uniref:Predicted membrane protein YciQ-like C-terminal domain-containing protein n=1 Tax=Roseibium algae TaxID=3123038 RepID=A0ABU8TI01_9HYPH